MLRGALINFDKSYLLTKNWYGNGLIMCRVVHKTHRKKDIRIVDKRFFII